MLFGLPYLTCAGLPEALDGGALLHEQSAARLSARADTSGLPVNGVDTSCARPSQLSTRTSRH